MKKALIASTALLLTAGVAAADVTVSGYGRTGIIYVEDRGGDDSSENNAQVVSRLRMNLDASTSTDSGVDFGARFRLQWDQGSSSTGANPGKLWISSQGLTVEVGNIDTAFDSNGLIYETELGAFDRSVGFSDVAGYYYDYAPKSYGAENNRVGVRALYAVDNLTVQGSYVDPDQTGLNETPTTEEEFGVSIDYKWDDRLELSAAAAFNGLGIDGNDIFFLGARYAVAENARVGLNFVDGGDEDDIWGYGQTVAIYGDYTLADGRTNLEAYVAYNNADRDILVNAFDGEKETNTAFGLGANYDLGGARLGASLQRGYDKKVTADMGVRFNF